MLLQYTPTHMYTHTSASIINAVDIIHCSSSYHDYFSHNDFSTSAASMIGTVQNKMASKYIFIIDLRTNTNGCVCQRYRKV